MNPDVDADHRRRQLSNHPVSSGRYTSRESICGAGCDSIARTILELQVSGRFYRALVGTFAASRIQKHSCWHLRFVARCAHHSAT